MANRYMISDSRSSVFPGMLLLVFELIRGREPEELEGHYPLERLEKTAPEEFPEGQVLQIASIDGVTVGSEDSSSVEFPFDPLGINVHPEFPGKVLGEEEIMVPLAEADPDPGAPQGGQPLHDGHKARINGIALPEPEIEEISCNDQMIQHDRVIGPRPMPDSIPSPETVQKSDELFMDGVPCTLQVSVGEKDHLHNGPFPGGRCFFPTAAARIPRRRPPIGEIPSCLRRR